MFDQVGVSVLFLCDIVPVLSESGEQCVTSFPHILDPTSPTRNQIYTIFGPRGPSAQRPKNLAIGVTADQPVMLEKLSLISSPRHRERRDLGSNKEITQILMPPEGSNHFVIMECLYISRQVLEIVLNSPDQFAGARGICDDHWK